jgi:hypothetical protein
MLGREKWLNVVKTVQHQRVRLAHESKVLDRSSTEPQGKATKSSLQKALQDGPDLGDFIAGVVPRNSSQSYEGQLRLDKGQKGRLRLPPWLKTEIPVGKNFSKIKDDLRGMIIEMCLFLAWQGYSFDIHFRNYFSLSNK